MAARAGEDVAAILFADVHYFYGSPTVKPPHHRFDKGSYVYLFEDAGQRKARLEIANNAGTAEQDAFEGFLDNTHIEYSYRHSCLVTLRVDPSSSQAPNDTQQWHLPTYDPRNETKYLYKLHTVDLYFWAKEDALQFLNAARRVLPLQQVRVTDEPNSPVSHQEAISPVVQQLENVAISNAGYQGGRTHDSNSAVTMTFPGPPKAPTPPQEQKSSPAPPAYNPAAPAAPEAIRHREKTPPPEDGVDNPLFAAAVADQRYGSGYPSNGLPPPPPGQAPSQQSYFNAATQPLPSAGLQSPYSHPMQSPGLQSPYSHPMQSPGLQSPYSHPMQSPGLQSSFGQFPGQQSSSVPPPPPAGVSGPPANPTIPQTSQASNQSIPQHVQYAQYPGSPGIAQPLASPVPSALGSQYANQSIPVQSPPVKSPPPGGYSSFQYAGNPGQPLNNDYSVHQQAYRPTEGEHAVKFTDKPPGQPRGKFEDRAEKVEKRVGGFLKKLEKRYG